MRYSIFLLLVLAQFANAQDYPKFVLTKDGVEPIVVEFDSMSSATLHAKAFKWIQKSYKSPQDVIKANLEGEEIRIEGFKEGALYYTTMGKKIFLDTEYILTIQFKDRRVRLIYQPGQFWITGYSTKASMDYTTFFKKSGELKGAYSDCKPSLEESMNEVATSLCDFLNDMGEKAKDDW